MVGVGRAECERSSYFLPTHGFLSLTLLPGVGCHVGAWMRLGLYKTWSHPRVYKQCLGLIG